MHCNVTLCDSHYSMVLLREHCEKNLGVLKKLHLVITILFFFLF